MKTESNNRSVVLKAPPTGSRPSFALRGIHLNGWVFRSPYSFRGWKEADWQRYLDLLASQEVNLFFLWPFMEIIPLPLAAADRDYLEEVRRVVDYARRRHKMEVWIFQSPNRVALNDCGVRDPRQRPYWLLNAKGDYPCAGQVDLIPTDPKQFARIMKSRETLYRIVNNADGYCTIDCDPGYCPGTPVSDYLKILKASRPLLDKHTVLGKRTKLIHWLWLGWTYSWWEQRAWWEPGADKRPLQAAVAEFIRLLKAELPEPWWLIAGMREYLPACAAEGVLGKTVYLPYGITEGEPARPATQVDFPRQREYLDEAARHPGLAGLMGNAQTPLLQFPHVGHLLRTAWNEEYRKRTARQSLLDSAALVYPRHRELLADCWLALAPAGRARAGALARRWERLIRTNRLGRPGPLGQHLFPDRRQFARDLLCQLQAGAAYEGLCEAVRRRASRERCARLLEASLAAALEWDQRHGWSAHWKTQGAAQTLWEAQDPSYPELVRGLRETLGGDPIRPGAVAVFLEPIGRRLARRYDPWIVGQCGLEPLAKALLEPKPASA